MDVFLHGVMADPGDPRAVTVNRDFRMLVRPLVGQEEQLLVLPQVALVEQPERPEIDLPTKGAALFVTVAH